MDESLRHFNPNPTLSANFISRGLFCWLNPLFKKGRERPLEIEDMYNVAPQDGSDQLGANLEREWLKEVKKSEDTGGRTKPSLLKALIRLFGFRYLLLGFIVFIEEGVRVVQPLLLGGLIRFFTPNSRVTEMEAYLYAMGVSLCAIVIAIAHHPYFFGVTRMGMQMRVACCSLMYKKAIRLSNTAMGQTTTGQIVNLMSNDVNRFDQAVIFLHFLWIGPLQSIVVLVILWYELGPSVLAGFAVLLLLIPVQASMGKLFSKLRRKTALHTDERVKVMNEIIAGMRVIKMYCWEKPFGELVEKIRSLEVYRIRRARYLQALILAPNFFSVKLILLLTFLTVVLVGSDMTSDKVFVTIAIYQAIRVPITVFIPFAVQNIAEMRISFDRLQPGDEVGSADLLPGRDQRSDIFFHPQIYDAAHPCSLPGFGWHRHLCQGLCDPLSHQCLASSNLDFYTGGRSLHLGILQCLSSPGDCFLLPIVGLNMMPGVAASSPYLSALRKEVRYIRLVNYIYSNRYTLSSLRANLFLLPIFWVIVSLGNDLRAESLYLAIVTFSIVRDFVVWRLSLSIAGATSLHVTLSRVKKFLLLDELTKNQSSVIRSELRPKPEDCSVTIDNLTAKWNPELEQNTLEHISASVKAGQLLAVIGPVGAGKSSLLMAILGELEASSGSVSVKGKVAYVSQQAWVFSGSLRQNIIFGSPYDKGRFDKVVRASAMSRDLEIMPHGDSTLIGDRGVSLSGGQRARVSLARALYTDADIFLLDDPLSAVDAAVGRHIFDKCIQGVLRKKPRILVTHQLQYLTAADSILILNEGRVECVGTYEELCNSGVNFAELLKSSEEEELIDPPMSAVSDHGPPTFVNYSSQMSLVSATSDFEPEPVQLPEEEERQTGTVGLRVYVEYFKAGAGIFKFLLLIVFNIVAQVTYIMSDWWLSRWSNAEEERIAATDTHQSLLSQGYNHTNVTIPYVDSYRNIYIFTGIIAAVFIFGMVRALLFFKVAVDASQKLHNSMFTRILRSPISFFDINPVGRILNRFAKDVGHMDDNLPITFFDFVQCFLLILGIVLVAGIVNPYVFIPTVPLVALFFYIRHYYLSTSRSIKRLEGTCRSPVFSYLSASLQGLHTIRAFGMEEKCQAEFDAHQDLHSEAWFLFLSTSRWLAVRLDWLCALFVTAVTFCAVLAAGTLDAGLVGLSITYSMTLMGMFQWGVRQSAEVENQMISVERVLEYSLLPSEAALESEEKRRPPDDWPDCGAIQADNVCLRYFPAAPVVLKNLTFRIREKEKVGIVGRTGAGKSSLITCLFRLVEPTGHLSIDGIDILQLGLHDLRKTISIIPQDPVLFTGTLRKNLDPFLHHGDQQLWKALEEVQLKSAVDDLPLGLETLVSEGGVNFSVGQRQLICLARAILRKNRILLIDEATANVDPKTDELIQETIRDKFRECTVLTIAHRLHTIMDSDRVMVLSDGRIMEFEAPHLLLQRGSGMLYDMVQQTGKTEADFLASIAADAYANRHHDNSHRSSGIESLMEPERFVDTNHSTAHKSNRAPEKAAVLDDINLNAPLALAESFHSLLRGETREDDDDSSDDAGAGNGGVLGGDVPGDSSRDAGEPRKASQQNVGDVASPPEEDPVVLVHAPIQVFSPPDLPDQSQNRLDRSALTDTSFDDDVFAEDPSVKTAAVRSNFLPVASLAGRKIMEEKKKEVIGEEGQRSRSDFSPHVESGAGAGADSSWSDADNTTSGFVTQLDTPLSEGDRLLDEGSNTSNASPALDEPGDDKTALLSNAEMGQLPENAGSESRLGEGEMGKLLGDAKKEVSAFAAAAVPGDGTGEELTTEKDVEDSSELDVLIVSSSASDMASSVHS